MGIHPVQASARRESTRLLRNPPDLGLFHSFDVPSYVASLLPPRDPFMLPALRPPATSSTRKDVSLAPSPIPRDPLASHMAPLRPHSPSHRPRPFSSRPPPRRCSLLPGAVTPLDRKSSLIRLLSFRRHCRPFGERPARVLMRNRPVSWYTKIYVWRPTRPSGSIWAPSPWHDHRILPQSERLWSRGIVLISTRALLSSLHTKHGPCSPLFEGSIIKRSPKTTLQVASNLLAFARSPVFPQFELQEETQLRVLMAFEPDFTQGTTFWCVTLPERHSKSAPPSLASYHLV